jgi:hypothetical protein
MRAVNNANVFTKRQVIFTRGVDKITPSAVCAFVVRRDLFCVFDIEVVRRNCHEKKKARNYLTCASGRSHLLLLAGFAGGLLL